MNEHQDITSRWTRLAVEAKGLGLATIPIAPESVLMVLGKLSVCPVEKSAGCQNDYQAAIDISCDRAVRKLDGGFHSHHNALIYAANELENAQAFGREASHEP